MNKHLCKSLILILLLLSIVVATSAYSVNAQTIPSFPSCLNPQGVIRVSYSSGTHGVVGDATTYTGTDVVYQLTNDTLIQCLCPPNGDGIQTNWWKVSQLTNEEIDILKAQGWIYIPNGSLWGLDNPPYLAKNISYRCVGGAGGNGGSSNNGDGGSSSSGSSNGSNNGGSGGNNAGTTTQKIGEVLGLASTGNIASILFYLISGIMILSIGIYLHTLRSRKSA